jgi:nitrogenase molybdenum-cofactor synthesis protein NifE
MKEIKKTLLNIADELQDKPLRKDILDLTKRKEVETYKKIVPYAEKLKDKKVFIYSGGVKSWSFVYLLEELGLEVIGTSTRKSTDEDIEHFKGYFEGKQKILMEQGDGIKILELMQKHNADLLLAGGRNRYTSIKGMYPFVDINQERLHAYSGYKGIIRLTKDIYNEFSSPVFKIARGPF